MLFQNIYFSPILLPCHMSKVDLIRTGKLHLPSRTGVMYPIDACVKSRRRAPTLEKVLDSSRSRGRYYISCTRPPTAYLEPRTKHGDGKVLVLLFLGARREMDACLRYVLGPSLSTSTISLGTNSCWINKTSTKVIAILW